MIKLELMLLLNSQSKVVLMPLKEQLMIKLVLINKLLLKPNQKLLQPPLLNPNI